jgi:hypothetical protein
MSSIDQKILQDIHQYGWSNITVFPTTEDSIEPFGYSVGFQLMEHPEVIVIGLGYDQMHHLLWNAYKTIQGGRRLRADTYSTDILEGLRVAFLEVLDPSGDYPLAMAHRLYGDVAALQMVWPDERDRFPWHSDYNSEYQHRQPLLGVWGGDD